MNVLPFKSTLTTDLGFISLNSPPGSSGTDHFSSGPVLKSGLSNCLSFFYGISRWWGMMYVVESVSVADFTPELLMKVAGDLCEQLDICFGMYDVYYRTFDNYDEEPSYTHSVIYIDRETLNCALDNLGLIREKFGDVYASVIKGFDELLNKLGTDRIEIVL